MPFVVLLLLLATLAAPLAGQAWNAPEALAVYVKRLADPLPDNRVLALLGLMKLNDRSVMESVQAKLSDEHPDVRAQAVATVALLGGASARPSLEALQKKEPSPNVLSVLDEALAKLPR
jgi:HEAT repeat protein